MREIKWSLGVAIIGVIAGFLHYSLPSRDIVYVLNTDVVRMDVASVDALGNDITRSHDQMRINTIRPGGEERVYRNEDTGWGFPWFFKFDSADLAARAENLKSSQDAPRWVVVTHYGWRFRMLSWFPNAVSIRPADGPDEDLTPWFNIAFLVIFVVVLLMLRRILLILFARHVDPVIHEIDREIDARSGWISRNWRKLRRGIGL